MKKIIVVGINTDVGKTVVSAIITEALGGYYWKPIQCGLPSDREWVEKRLTLPNRTYPERYFFKEALSPHKGHVRIKTEELIPPDFPHPLIIEGAGGLLSPLNERESWADIPFGKADWILVHRPYIGSLNHFFLTVEAMKQRRLPLLGVIFNGTQDKQTEEMLLTRTNTRCLARLSWQQNLSIKELAAECKHAIG